MKTEGLIKFLVEKEFINYSEDYEIIDEIINRLEEHDEIEKEMNNLGGLVDALGARIKEVCKILMIGCSP